MSQLPILSPSRTEEVKLLLRQMFDAAVASANPAEIVSSYLPEPPRGRVVVVGAGKSAAAMARAVEDAWAHLDLSGVVVTRYGHTVATRRIEVIEAAHPVPDSNGLIASQRILAAVSGLSSDDLVLALISGGGSALMPMPAPELSLQDKIDVNRLLLASGLPISLMNQVRRRLSAIKGGKLARAAMPARLVTLAISDVPGDDPITIASGPTVWDPDEGSDYSFLVDLLGPTLPHAARRLLAGKTAPNLPFQTDFRIIATPMMALHAAAEFARVHGFEPLILSDEIEGEAKAVGTVMAAVAKSATRHGSPIRGPAVLLSGGETTVTLGTATYGRGGRNTEFLLALAIALDTMPGIYAIAGDTDGIDGTDDAAGAIVTPDTLMRARAVGLDPAALLENHDSYTLFDTLHDLVRTGPTLTNVNDFRAIVIDGSATG